MSHRLTHAPDFDRLDAKRIAGNSLALLVHALDDKAKQFYLHYGFVESPLHPLTLMLPLHTA